MTGPDEMVLPHTTSMFQLNPDGSYSPSTSGTPSIFIRDDQACKMWDPVVAKHIRETYGPIVGLIHEELCEMAVPVRPSFMYILGA